VSSGEHPVAPVRFREVAFEDVGRVSEPHYVRGPAFVVWVTGPALAGIFATAPVRVPDLERALTLYPQLCAAPHSRSLFSDARTFSAEGAVFGAMLHATSELMGSRTSRGGRAAIVLPEGWSRAWWIGAAAMDVIAPMPTKVFSEHRDAWAWLGASDAEREAVEQLTATFSTQAELRARLEGMLRAEPGLGVERASRQLGASARALQRILSATGESFADVRARARAEIASARLTHSDDKIDTVAAETGFRSRSHFIAWFRGLTGMSPAAFRERYRTGRSQST
jgi:AraC-like DNA-binding protein